MIAKIWRGLTRAGDRHDFMSLLQARVQAQLATSRACLGAYVLQREIAGSQAESLVLTLHHEAAHATSPGECDPPAISEKEARLLLGYDPTAASYEVMIDPQRAVLYAELRRRFPLRFAAPR